jgi:T6SS, Phospholipase effector Tle1-like, catalytic domain
MGTLTSMTKSDPTLAKIAAQFTRYDVKKSGGGYMILHRRTANPVARLRPIAGTDRFELFYWSNVKARWSTFGNLGRMKLMLESAHEIGRERSDVPHPEMPVTSSKLAKVDLRWVHNKVAEASGFGITRNIIDCYAAPIQLWQPDDRIFLFGFSRGAYTVRCLAGVVAKCGIPRYPPKNPDQPLKLDQDSAYALASYAVKHIYQFTNPRKMKDATPRQKFLLEIREELAKRFRDDCGSGDAGDPNKANVYPHFIAVFDTVAALGNPVTSILYAFAFLAFAAGLGIAGWVLTHFDKTPLVGWLFAYLSFQNVFLGTVAIAALVATAIYIFTHFKWAHELFHEDWKMSLRTIHFNELWMQFYDYDLNPNVNYARHAISINENRKNFQRVKWYSIKDTSRDEHGIQWFEQVWFAGNHSDIGGSYPENESRLSDIALDWMLKWATVVPGELKCDARVLKRSPYPEGMQHDEVQVGFGLITKLTGYTRPKENRKLPAANAVVHRSVYQRFDLRAVQVYNVMVPYRPETLETHKDFEPYYEPGGTFPRKFGGNGHRNGRRAAKNDANYFSTLS